MKKIVVKIICAFIPSSSMRKKFRGRMRRYWPNLMPVDYGFITKNERPVIIDCGANVGNSVLFFNRAHSNAVIIAIEADRDIFEKKLVPNLARDAISPNNITCINKAAWIDTKGVSFFPDGYECGSCIQGAQTDIKIKPIQVESLRLRDLLKEYKHIDFLKIDIEGAEVEVIRDSIDMLDRVDRLFIEYHSFTGRPQQLSEILRILEDLSFRYRLTEDYNPKNLYWEYGDNDNGMDCQVKIFALSNRLASSP